MKQLLALPARPPAALLAGARMPLPAPRHEGVILLGTRAGALLHPAMLTRLARRLTSPAARIEGLDRHLDDAQLAQAAEGAGAFVLRLPPLGNLDNPFYRVHRKRNDRFLRAHAPLKSLFPEVDFTAFDFTGHLLGALYRRCPERFARLRAGLEAAWLEKLAALLGQLPRRGVLLGPVAPHWLALDGALPVGGERVLLPLPGEDAVQLAQALGQVLQALLKTEGPASRHSADGPLILLHQAQSFSVSSGTAAKRSATRP